MSYDQWHRLTDDAKNTWDMLTDEAKSIILKPTSEPPPPRRRINQHDIQHLVSCLQDTELPDNHHVPTVSASLHAQNEGSNHTQESEGCILTPEDQPEPPPC